MFSAFNSFTLSSPSLAQILILEFALKCLESQKRLQQSVQKGVFSERDILENSLHYELSENSLRHLYRRLLRIHQIASAVCAGRSVRESAREGEGREGEKGEEGRGGEGREGRVYTHWDLFRAVDPVAAAYYERVLSRCTGDAVAAYECVSNEWKDFFRIFFGFFSDDFLGFLCCVCFRVCMCM